MNDTELGTLLALRDISGIGDSRAYELYAAFDGLDELLAAPDAAFDGFHYVDTETLAAIRGLDDAIDEYRRTIEEWTESGVAVLGPDDDAYPEAVQAGPGPVLLYVVGDINQIRRGGIAVSGSRETNETGQAWVREVTAELARTRPVVSGGALGADTAAHEGALESTGSTVVVLGTGVETPYPPANELLFDQIVDTGGALVSMRPPDAEPARYAFVERNALIAALSEAVLIVATDGSGGTIAQYEAAVRQDRPVFLPPAESGVRPNEGIEELRSKETTTTVQSATDLVTELESSGVQTRVDRW